MKSNENLSIQQLNTLLENNFIENEVILKQLMKLVILKAKYPFNRDTTVQIIGKLVIETGLAYYRFEITNGSISAVEKPKVQTPYVSVFNNNLSVHMKESIQYLRGMEQQVKSLTAKMLLDN